MPVPINNVPFGEAVLVFRRFEFEVISRRHRGKGSHVILSDWQITITLTDWVSRPMRGPTLGSEVERAGIDITAFLWGVGPA